MSHCYRTILIFAFALIAVMRMHGQESPEIRDIQALIRRDSLACSFAAPQLFSGKIKQTLLSGLPVLIELQTHLLKNDSENDSFPLLKYRLTYDIWEDQFFMESAGKKTVFASLETLEKWWNPREHISLLPLAQVDGRALFKIDVYLRIILLTRSQGEKLKDWILNPQETEENFPSLNRDAGFKLNLNQVVSLFFSKSDVIESFEARQTSEAFKIEDLEIQD